MYEYSMLHNAVRTPLAKFVMHDVMIMPPQTMLMISCTPGHGLGKVRTIGTATVIIKRLACLFRTVVAVCRLS